MEKTNIAAYLPEVARLYPRRRAVIQSAGRDRLGRVLYSHLTFAQLESLANFYARELRGRGLAAGGRTLLFLRPGLDFIAMVFAVFKVGAAPVLIDPGMGRSNLLRCVASTEPQTMIAVPAAHWLARLFPHSFRSVETSFAIAGLNPPGVVKLRPPPGVADDGVQFEVATTKLDDTAALVFTTGSTGPPKGVIYKHGIFISQTEIIRDVYGAGPNEIDMPAFPLFALFSAALGMTSVIPDMDPTRPARVNPERIIEAVNNQGVTFSFASPALWRRVADYCAVKGIRLNSLKKALMAGAPVPAELHAKVKKIIAPDGETIVPYGATESLPVANFSGGEMLAETAKTTANGGGYCVGRPVPGLTVKIIEAVNKPITIWHEHLAMPVGQIGEIVVKGPVVTREYYRDEAHTEAAKITDGDGVWHRMGDVGHIDAQGRLWFRGRKAHRVLPPGGAILYSVCCEAVFNQHPDVFRSALVGIGEPGSQTPVIVVEPRKGKMPGNDVDTKRFINELKHLASSNKSTAKLDQFLFHPSFPVDIRHNAKIFREKLAAWATGKVNF